MQRNLRPKPTTFQDASRGVTTFQRAALLVDGDTEIPESAVLSSLDDVDPLDIDRRWPVYEAAATATKRRRLTPSLPRRRR